MVKVLYLYYSDRKLGKSINIPPIMRNIQLFYGSFAGPDFICPYLKSLDRKQNLMLDYIDIPLISMPEENKGEKDYSKYNLEKLTVHFDGLKRFIDSISDDEIGIIVSKDNEKAWEKRLKDSNLKKIISDSDGLFSTYSIVD